MALPEHELSQLSDKWKTIVRRAEASDSHFVYREAAHIGGDLYIMRRRDKHHLTPDEMERKFWTDYPEPEDYE